MANVKKTIDIIFAGVDNLSGTVNTVSGKMSTFGDQVGNVSEPLANITDSILKINTALLALGGVGLAYAYSKSIEFEDATVELQKVLGDQPSELAKAQKAAFDLSAQYGESSSDILMSTANFKQAGFEIQDSMILTKSAMDLSIAGSIGSAEASELLISTLKGFKAPASDAIRLVDVLNEVSNSYATSAKSLGIGMAALSPIASLMGFSFEETAGILTPVIEIFRSGDEAAVALRTGLLRLIDDQKPVTDALASIGVAQHDANGSLRSGKDILFDVATAFKTTAEENKLFLAAQLVGIPQSARMVEVFNGLATSMEVTSVAMNSAGSAALEVTARLESGTVVVNRFKEGFANLAITVGDQFLEAGKKSIDGATAIENSLQQIIKDGTFDPVFDALSEFSIDIGKFLNDVAIAMPEAFENVDWSGLLEAFDSIGGKFGELFKDIDLTKPEELTEVIQFVIDSLESLIQITSGMVSAFAPIVEGIIKSISGFNLLDEKTKETTGGILAIAKAITNLGIVFSGILITLGQNAEVIKSVFSVVVNSIGFLWDTATITIKSIQLAFYDLVKASWELADVISLGLSDAVKEQIKATDTLQESLKSDILKAYASQVDHVGSAFRSMVGDSKDASLNIEGISTSINELPADVEIKLDVSTEDVIHDFDYFLDMVDSFPETVESEISIDTDRAELVIHNFKTEIEEIPTDKLLEISLKGEIDTDIAKIKARAETIQNSVEWTAKLNIAEAESSAKMFVSVVEGMANTITSTGDLLGGLFGMLAEGDLDIGTQWDIEDQIKEEAKMRKDAHESQIKLNEAQKDYMEAKTDAIESGEGLINITADGLEPEIEAFMWKILEKIQIRANEESSEFLLGV